MKANEKGFRRLYEMAMKYKVRTDMSAPPHGVAECLVCGWKSKLDQWGDSWNMRCHIESHIENDQIKESDFVGKS